MVAVSLVGAKHVVDEYEAIWFNPLSIDGLTWPKEASTMVPLWLFLIAVGLFAASGTLHIMRSCMLLPPFDTGSPIISATNGKAAAALVAIARRLDFLPAWQAHTPLARRYIFANGWIINVPSPKAQMDGFGDGGSFALVCDCPEEAADMARGYLVSTGFSAEIIPNPDPDIPPGSMYFVKTDAILGHGMLVFRLRIDKMPRAKKWNGTILHDNY